MSQTIHLADKYAKAVQERFYEDSLTQSSFSKDMDAEFIGVKTVKYYEVDTVPLGDYQRSGSNRFGELKELGDTVYEMTMTQDKAFTYSIDKGNAKEQFNIKQASTSLRRQMREVVTPFIDMYRMNKWATDGGQHVALDSAPTKTTIVETIFSATEALDNAFVPKTGRTLYVRNDVYKAVKLADEFIKLEDTGKQRLVNGVVGKFDGMDVKPIPASRMPAGVYFMIIYKNAALSPMKLQEYRIQKDPIGVSGDVVEGRVIFDAFIKPTKAAGIYVATEKGKVAATPSVTVSGGTATLTSTTSGATIKYTLDGSDPRFSATAEVYSTDAKPAVGAGVTIKAYAAGAGLYNSNVAEAVG